MASTTPANAARNNEYVVTVSATSGTGAREMTANQTIIVTVTNVDEAPTGKPTISGSLNVLETLSAETDAIGDPDGLTSPGYTYQWIRVDGNNATDISGATSQTYQVTAADLGKKLKVQVGFTDDGGFAETLTSEETGIVQAALVGVTINPAPPNKLTVAEGSSNTYTVVLAAQPISNVTVTVTRKTGGDSDLSLSGSPLTFTSTNWDTAQTLTVSAAEDNGGFRQRQCHF